MLNVATALYSFFSSFNIPAYAENTVPDGTQMPYITYRMVQPDWRSKTSMYARVWYRSTSFIEVATKVDEIRQALGEGISIKTDDGAVYLWSDEIWCQFMSPEDADPTLKCAYLNFVMQANTY